MPLNPLQRDTLFRTITLYVDSILDSSVDRAKKIEWLQLSTRDAKTTMEEAVQVFKEHPGLTKGLAEAVTVPRVFRGYWKTLLDCIAGGQSIPDNLLKALLSGCNNHNPLLIAEMRLFENKINDIPEIGEIKKDLILVLQNFSSCNTFSSRRLPPLVWLTVCLLRLPVLLV